MKLLRKLVLVVVSALISAFAILENGKLRCFWKAGDTAWRRAEDESRKSIERAVYTLSVGCAARLLKMLCGAEKRQLGYRAKSARMRSIEPSALR